MIDVSIKKEFLNLLRSTKRDGMEETIEELQELGFFDAPASCNNHLNYDGGLMEHSLNVYRAAIKLRDVIISMDKNMDEYLPQDSVIIASLLHDVCKADIYKKVTKKKKDKFGTIQTSQGFRLDYTNFPLGHGEKSVIVLLRAGLAMSDYEIMAIRWHMAAWDLAFQSQELRENINKARDFCPLCSLIQCADTIAANILERKNTEAEDDFLWVN